MSTPSVSTTATETAKPRFAHSACAADASFCAADSEMTSRCTTALAATARCFDEAELACTANAVTLRAATTATTPATVSVRFKAALLR